MDNKDSKDVKDSIKSYLDERAKMDELFAVKYANPKKNFSECLAYIMGEVIKNSSTIAPSVEGCMIDNDVVFGLAVHYYDEDNIKINKLPTGCRTSATSAKVELTEQDKKAAREEAIKRLADEQYALLKKKPSKAKKEVTEVQQMSLF